MSFKLPRQLCPLQTPVSTPGLWGSSRKRHMKQIPRRPFRLGTKPWSRVKADHRDNAVPKPCIAKLAPSEPNEALMGSRRQSVEDMNVLLITSKFKWERWDNQARGRWKREFWYYSYLEIQRREDPYGWKTFPHLEFVEDEVLVVTSSLMSFPFPAFI